jgi:hypothetical protein
VDCPVHKEPLRVEYACNAPKGEPWATGFCLKCLRHYPCCTSTYGTTGCVLVEGHELPHRSSHAAWMDPMPWKGFTYDVHGT